MKYGRQKLADSRLILVPDQTPHGTLSVMKQR